MSGVYPQGHFCPLYTRERAGGYPVLKIFTIDQSPDPLSLLTASLISEALSLLAFFFHSGLWIPKVLMKDLLTRSTLKGRRMPFSGALGNS